MKYDKETGYILFGEREHSLHFINNWAQLKYLFGDRFNWYEWNLALFDIYIEKDKMIDGVEFRFAILGLGFSFRYNFGLGEEGQEIVDRAKEIMEKVKEKDV